MVDYFTVKPAFGFQTKSCNAEGYYQAYYESEAMKEFARREVAAHKAGRAYFDITREPGFDEAVEQETTKAAQRAWRVSNWVKILGYFPLIGTVVGLRRMAKAAMFTKHDLPNKYHHIARGSVELLSLGFLLVIPDLILSIYRSHQAKKASSIVPEAV